jgi:hypothetical protein
VRVLPNAAGAFPAVVPSRSHYCRKTRGETAASNLALACPHCNLYKGPNIAGVDPASGQVVRLFHPRMDNWNEHFRFETARIVGASPIGRVTVQVLAMNAEDFILFRTKLLEQGASPA